MSRGRRSRGAAVARGGVVAALAIAACSLVTALDGLSSGSSGSPLADGGATPDVVADTSAGEDGGDGAADAPFCKSKTSYALCADFDEGPVPTPFSRTLLGGPSDTVVYDDVDFRSSPRAALFTGGVPTNVTNCALEWDAPAVPTEMVIDFDVKVETSGTGTFDVIGLERSSHAVELQMRGNGALEFEVEAPSFDGGEVTTPVLGLLTAKTWHHVQLSLSKGSSAIQVKTTLDGAVAGNTTVSLELLAGPSVLYLSDAVIQATPTPWRVRYDNVLVVIR